MKEVMGNQFENGFFVNIMELIIQYLVDQMVRVFDFLLPQTLKKIAPTYIPGMKPQFLFFSLQTDSGSFNGYIPISKFVLCVFVP